MSILDKLNIKSKTSEMLKNLKLNLVKYMTPVNYLEYCVKMLFIIHPKRIRLMMFVDIIIHLILFITSIPFPTLYNRSSILLSLCYTIVALNFIYYWRIKKGNRKISHKDGDIKLKPIEIKEFAIPKRIAVELSSTKESSDINKIVTSKQSDIQKIIDTEEDFREYLK